jgi:hypothetical protein
MSTKRARASSIENPMPVVRTESDQRIIFTVPASSKAFSFAVTYMPEYHPEAPRSSSSLTDRTPADPKPSKQDATKGKEKGKGAEKEKGKGKDKGKAKNDDKETKAPPTKKARKAGSPLTPLKTTLYRDRHMDFSPSDEEVVYVPTHPAPRFPTNAVTTPTTETAATTAPTVGLNKIVESPAALSTATPAVNTKDAVDIFRNFCAMPRPVGKDPFNDTTHIIPTSSNDDAVHDNVDATPSKWEIDRYADEEEDERNTCTTRVGFVKPVVDTTLSMVDDILTEDEDDYVDCSINDAEDIAMNNVTDHTTTDTLDDNSKGIVSGGVASVAGDVGVQGANAGSTDGVDEIGNADGTVADDADSDGPTGVLPVRRSHRKKGNEPVKSRTRKTVISDSDDDSDYSDDLNDFVVADDAPISKASDREDDDEEEEEEEEEDEEEDTNRNRKDDEDNKKEYDDEDDNEDCDDTRDDENNSNNNNRKPTGWPDRATAAKIERLQYMLAYCGFDPATIPLINPVCRLHLGDSVTEASVNLGLRKIRQTIATWESWKDLDPRWFNSAQDFRTYMKTLGFTIYKNRNKREASADGKGPTMYSVRRKSELQ